MRITLDLGQVAAGYELDDHEPLATNPFDGVATDDVRALRPGEGSAFLGLVRCALGFGVVTKGERAARRRRGRGLARRDSERVEQSDRGAYLAPVTVARLARYVCPVGAAGDATNASETSL